MEVIEKVDQGSEDWLKLRKGKVTASNFHKIITPTGREKATLKSHAMEIAMELFSQEDDEAFSSLDMQRGVELEKDARKLYQEKTLTKVHEIGFFDCGDYGCSPDGLCGDDGLIEIKCPKNHIHIGYILKGEIPSEYYAQCQGALLCSGRKWIDFISYNKNFKPELSLFIKRTYRDEGFIENLRDMIVETIRLRNKYIFILDKTLTKGELKC